MFNMLFDLLHHSLLHSIMLRLRYSLFVMYLVGMFMLDKRLVMHYYYLDNNVILDTRYDSLNLWLIQNIMLMN